VAVGPGDKHDSVRFIDVVDGIRIERGVGRPISRPKELYADPAYDSNRIRAYLRHRGIRANIPLNSRNGRRPKRGKPCRFDEEGHRRVKSSVERFFAWLR
jgi:hypothetical protein